MITLNTTTTRPDSENVATPKPSTVHYQVNTFITTYSAFDPLSSTGGQVELNGFLGWPQTSTAS
ncbi:MAG: hypothetical protein ACLP62_02795 [Acidimicrobiales bacterium]